MRKVPLNVRVYRGNGNRSDGAERGATLIAFTVTQADDWFFVEELVAGAMESAAHDAGEIGPEDAEWWQREQGKDWERVSCLPNMRHLARILMKAGRFKLCGSVGEVFLELTQGEAK